MYVVALLVVAACGGSNINLSGEYPVSAIEFEFIPNSGVIGAGDTEVVFTNAGSILHEFAVLSQPIETEGEFSEDLVLFEVEAEAGETVRGTLSVEPGSYQVVCVIQGHFSAGMKGTLVVSS